MAKTESKSYDPASVEQRIFSFWQQGGFFEAAPDERAEPFCIVIPPPNVTGALHLGHALNNTLQDILTRRARMMGKSTLWLVGTDHAGIATQATVEKTIRKTEGKNRHDLGREELVRRIWEWKEKFGGRIVEQLKLMGCSCDYSRERFTLDEGCAKAVRHTFFKLFRDGLIYRGKRLVNWDTQLQTAVADDEVYHETVKGHLWFFRYPIIGEHRHSAGGGGESSQTGGTPMLPDDAQFGRDYVVVATTRPETMLGDTAVAVHPDPAGALDKVEKELKTKLAEASEKERPQIEAALEDIKERRKTLLPILLKLRDMAKAGRKIRLPLVDREIPLICDHWAKPELGSGCVKITPAHDPNDYEVGLRHDLPKVNVLSEDGKVAEIVEPDGTANANSSNYAGLKFATAGREKVVADMQALGLVEKIEDRLIELGHSDRSKAPIEPFLSDQWFVKMGDLTAEEAEKIQTPFLKEYIANSTASTSCEEPRASARAAIGTPASPDSPRTFPGLAQMAIDAVQRGEVRFHPPRYKKTYIDWLSEKRDWCISRQLWWGHRIPVWYKRMKIDSVTWFSHVDLQCAGLDHLIRNEYEDGAIRVYEPTTGEEIEPGRLLEERPRSEVEYDVFVCYKNMDNIDGMRLEEYDFKQDPDVLDTWFSSALWPHSTLGWPDAENVNTIGGTTAARAEARSSSTEARGSSINSRDADEPQASACADSEREKPSLLEYFYPTNVLSTAREIITLWVARMVMTGLYNIGKVPFRDVVIHPVIQDGQGRKMSKSLGNGVDPVDIIDKYGADALRFTLADLATETQDIRMPVQSETLPDGRKINVSPKFEKGRNFCNKLWQAATGFVLRSLDGYQPTSLDPASLSLEDRWILSRMTACLETVEASLARYRYSEAINALYHFMWDDYCSAYLEMTKPRLNASTGGTPMPPDPSGQKQPNSGTQPRSAERSRTQQVLVYVLDQLLRMLHPFVPFVTEAIWAELNQAAPQRGLMSIKAAEPHLIAALWPTTNMTLRDEKVESQMAAMLGIVKAVREIRTLVNQHCGQAGQPSLRTLPEVIVQADPTACRLIQRYLAFVQPLAGCDTLLTGPPAAKPAGALGRMIGKMQVFVPVGDLMDLGAIRAAEEKKLADLRGALERAEKQLANKNFINRADPSIVEQVKNRADELSIRIHTIAQQLSDIG